MLDGLIVLSLLDPWFVTTTEDFGSDDVILVFVSSPTAVGAGSLSEGLVTVIVGVGSGITSGDGMVRHSEVESEGIREFFLAFDGLGGGKSMVTSVSIETGKTCGVCKASSVLVGVDVLRVDISAALLNCSVDDEIHFESWIHPSMPLSKAYHQRDLCFALSQSPEKGQLLHSFE